MADIVVRPAASADIADIYVFSLERFGIETADQYHDGLQAAIMRLAEYPESGPIYPKLRPPIRFHTYKRHHIFYEYDGATIWIIRILHHALDAGRLL
jgi:toxin ParE1/3/4